MTTAYNPSVICPILIGRTAELAAFHLLIDQVKSGRGQVALLWGEAGVGKSRLVAETKTYAASQGFLLLQGNCFQADRAFPYAPFLDLLRSCFSSSSPLTRHNELTSFAQEFSRFLPDVAPLLPEHYTSRGTILSRSRTGATPSVCPAAAFFYSSRHTPTVALHR